MTEIRESILSVRSALASKADAGPAPDRPAVAVMEDGLRCRAELGAEGADPKRLEELVAWADSHSPVGECVRRAVPVELEIAAE